MIIFSKQCNDITYVEFYESERALDSFQKEKEKMKQLRF